MNALALLSPDPERVEATLRRVRTAEMVPFYALESETDDGSLQMAIEAAERSLVPAGEARAAAGVDYAIRLLSAKALPADLLAGYSAILGDLPEDLLGKAIKAGCAGTTYHKLPPPGVFMAAARTDHDERKATLSRLLRHRERIQLVSRMSPHRASVPFRALPRPTEVVEATSGESASGRWQGSPRPDPSS
jgi:hypothetical protein